MASDFDPMRDVRFRGKLLADLTHSEAIQALSQALRRVHFLEQTRPPGVTPSYVPTNGPIEPLPFPPVHDFG